jgi:hypothetical protein
MRAILKIFLTAAIVTMMVAPARATTFTETFPDPLGGFYSRWLGANSNIGSYYLSMGDPDPNYRGNNPEGLWISGNQIVGGGVSGPLVTINFNPSFGSTLTSLSFGIEAFAQLEVRIYDMSNNLLNSGVFSGGDFGFGHEDIISATSANGISRFVLDSSAFGSVQVSGNTSVDNFVASTDNFNAIPEPSTLLLLGSGLGGLALAAWRRKK